MRSSFKYLFIAIVCFVSCILIVMTMSNYQTIRGFIGDVIIAILIYCFVKTFINIRPLKLSAIVLIFSYMVEVLQYFHLVDLIGLGESRMARIIIGTTFSYSDLIAYLLGVIIIFSVDTMFLDPKTRK